MSITISFKPWRPFEAEKDETVIRRFLSETAAEAEKAFHKGNRSAKSGRFYVGRSGRRIRASSPGQYPAIDKGALDKSVGSNVTKTTVTVGTNMPYSKFLRGGTSKMGRRKMSDNALEEGAEKTREILQRFVKWKR